MKLIRVGPASSIHANVRPYCLEHLAKKNLKKDLLSDSTEACERNQELLEEIYRVEREIQTLKGKNTGFNVDKFIEFTVKSFNVYFFASFFLNINS